MDEFSIFLDLLNETLASAIVILAASLSLYNLTRNVNNRVARTSGIVLFCVTIPYMSDVLIALEPGVGTFESLLRFQWVGLAFLPAATFHFSDALLATTGLPSRGRRTRVLRLLYILAAIFLVIVTFTDWFVRPDITNDRVSLRAAPAFALFVLYYLIVNGVAVFNMQRARLRCLTRGTRRRMTYLQFAILVPLIGVFPYSVFLNPGSEFTITSLLLVSIANFGIILTLVLLSYPLSFFGSHIPGRVVKADLLRFMLLGPGTGLIALIVIIFTAPATQFLGISGINFLPFAVVAAILLWQWAVDLALPVLEKRLIYSDEDDVQLEKLQNLSDRLLTRGDQLQLIEALLEATCDYLRVNRAFVASLNGEAPEVLGTIGGRKVTPEDLDTDNLILLEAFKEETAYQEWHDYWVTPLYSRRSSNGRLLGIMGVEERDEPLSEDDEEMLSKSVRRAAQILDDMQLQTEIYAALEGLLPQITVTRSRAEEVEYRVGRVPPVEKPLNRSEVIEQVHAALRHFWGGPGLSSSRLLELAIVHHALPENENNPVRALRTVLQEAIENQRPEGEPSMKSPEWTIYNILKLRFVENRKVRETARRLFMSDANFYRKQNVAIEALADTLIQMEQEFHASEESSIPESAQSV